MNKADEIQKDKPASNDRLVCACWGLTESELLAAFQRVGTSFERLVEETGVGSKCTACMLDVDLLLNGVVRDASAGKEVTITKSNSFFRRPDDQTNCGHYILCDGLNTTLRVANHPLMFNEKTPIVSYDWTLFLFSPEGRKQRRLSGRLEKADTLEIDFSEIEGLVERGWFIIDLLPRGEGMIASVRPQIGITGPDWVAPYHPQWLSFRTFKRGIMVRADEGRVDLAPVLINSHGSEATVTATLLGTDIEFSETRTAKIPPHGMIQFDCASEFSPPSGQHNMICSFQADHRLNYFAVNKHEDGSWCVDHFPNEK